MPSPSLFSVRNKTPTSSGLFVIDNVKPKKYMKK